MTLADVRDYLKTLGIGEHFYIGKLDRKKPHSIGVYQRDVGGRSEIAYGGLSCTKTRSKRVSILVHWDEYANTTEEASQRLYDALEQASDVTIGGKHVSYIQMESMEPVDVGTDDSGVYERVIWIRIYYKED